MNQLKQKIRNGENIIGMHLNFNDIGVAKIAGLAGYDYVWIDLEHSYLSLESLMGAIIAIQAGGTAAIVRVPQGDLTFTKKVLEMGPDGIIFPMVKSAEEANRMVGFSLYPPHGNRGFGPLNAVNFGIEDMRTYAENSVDGMCRFIQIEHKDAVADLDKIMENEFIDGYIFGPCDLSGSINELLDVYGEHTAALMQETVAKLKAAGKCIGLSTGDYSDGSLEHWRDMGINMISAGADFDFIRDGAIRNRKNMEKIIKGK